MTSGVSPWGTWPDNLAAIEIDSGDGAVGRFHEREALDVETPTASPTASATRDGSGAAGGQGRIVRVLTGPQAEGDLLSGGAGDVPHVGNFLGRLDEAG